MSAGILVAHAAGAPELEEAGKLIEQGLPTMAAAKLNGMNTSGWGEEDLRQHAIMRGRAFLAADRPADAARALGGLEADPEAAFWLAESFAATGDFEQAARLYATADGGPHATAARIGRARMLAAMGKQTEAGEILREETSPDARIELAALKIDMGRPMDALEILDALPTDIPRRAELLAHAKFASGDPASALELLSGIEPGNKSAESRLIRLKARLAIASGKPGTAASTLEAWISSNPGDPHAREFFDLLERAYASVSAPDPAPLRRWVADSGHPARAVRAALSLARMEARQGNSNAAIQAYKKFVAEADPEDPLMDTARSELAAQLTETGETTAAKAAVAEGRGPGLDFARGLASAASGDYEAAADFFHKAWEMSSWDSARHNALIATALSDRPLPEDTVWVLETRAMARAAKGNPAAEQLLEQLVACDPPSPRAALTLAEIRVVHGNPCSALPVLQKISNPDAATAERAAALAAFAEDNGSPDSAPRAMAAAEEFLRMFPDSELSPMVEMKLAEILFRRGDYFSAREHFTAVAESPAAEIAQQARFMAAQSAARSLDQAGMEEAIELYEDVARAGGVLAPRARLSQALLLNALGRPDEAVALINSLLESGPDPQIRYAALIEKGDALFSLGTTDPNYFAQAIATWRLAGDAPPRWRNQALVKIGAASEKLGENDAALSSYIDALDSPTGEDPEFFWSYKAGFDAARLLESLGRPSEAAALYARLAARNGPRAEEARQQLSRLQLENFLWDEPHPMTKNSNEKQ